MTDAIPATNSAVASGANAASAQRSSAPAQTDTTSGGGFAQGGATSSATTRQSQQTAQQMSPSISLDPQSGVMVTKYISGTGTVELQLPSVVSLAYLRMGLTETGDARPSNESVVA